LHATQAKIARSDQELNDPAMRHLLIVATLLASLLGGATASAQQPSPLLSPPAAPAAPVAPVAPAAPTPAALSPADIERVLSLLRDEPQRAAFIANLEALLRAGGAAPPQEEALIPLPPGSLGAQLLLGASDRIERLSDQVLATARRAYELPALISWIEAVWQSPWLREKALEAVGLVGLLIFVGWLGAWSMRRLAAGLYQRLGEAEGLPLLPRLLRVAGRFLLDLLSVAAFMAATYAVVLIAAPQLTSRLILLSVNNALIIVGLVMCVARALLSPTSPSLRPIPLTDATAHYLLGWVKRIVAVAVFGLVAAEAGLVLGMDPGSHASIGKLVWLVVSIMLIRVVIRSRRAVRRAIRASDEARGLWALTRNRIGDLWHVIAIIYIVAAWLVLAAEIPNGFERMLQISLASLIIFGIAKGLEDALNRGLESLFRAGGDAAAAHPGLVARAARYAPVLRRIAVTLLWIGAFLLLFEAWGLSPLDWFKGGALGARLAGALISIGITVAIALLIWEGANAGIERHLATLSRNAQTAKSARVRTLMPMLRTTLLVAIIVVTTVTILSEIGVNVAPLLAGAGVIGIAVGFGSQKLVQDVITGAFLLFEDAIAVGDVVSLGGQSGVVEQLTIRSIRLRALDGSIHIIPFSAVTTVTNMTRDYGYAVFDISVGYSADSDRVVQVLRDIGKEMREEDRWSAVIREPLDVMGVERLADSAVIVRARFKTDPASRWAVNREFLRRVKQRFDSEGIEIPFPSRRVVVDGPAGMSAAVRDAAAAAGSG
jgi:small-conductance mechanosensitive channel